MVLDTQIKATIVAGVDEKSFRDGVNYARDTGKKIDKNLVAEIKVNLATLQLKLSEATKILNKAKKDGDEAMKLTAQMNVNDIKKQITYVNGELNNMARTGDRNVSALELKFRKTNETIKDSTKEVKGLGGALGDVARTGGALVAAGIGTAIGFIGRNILTVAGAFQDYEIILKNALGSQEEARQSMELLKEISAETPFTLDQITQSYIKMVNRGIKPTKDEITSLGDLASSQGKSLDQLVEALLDAQTLEFERLKEFGIRSKKSGDDVSFTFKGVETTVKATDTAIKDYILSLGLLEGVAGGMEERSNTLNGALSNFDDAVTNLYNAIGSLFVPVITTATRAISGLVGVVTDRIEENPKLSSALGVVTGLLATLLGVSIAYTLALPALTAGVVAMGGALAILTGPIGLVIAGVGALYVAWNNNFLGMQETVGIFAERVRFAIEVVKVAFQRINAVVKPVMDSLRQITDRTTKAVVSSFDSLKGIGNRVKQAMDVALTVMTLGLNKLVAFTYRKLSELDFVVGLRAEATNNITRAEVARSQANNPNLLAPKKFDINDLDFSKATRISGSPSISIPDISAGGGAGGSGGGSSAKKEIEEVNTDLIRLEKQLDINANRYKELGKAGKVAFDAIDSAITDSGKTIDDLNSKLGKTQDELNSIEGSIAQRVINIQKELETVGDSLTGEITDKERNALERKQIDLQKELSLATQEVNQETLDELNRQDKLSETEKLLEKRDALTKEQEALKSQIEFEEQLNQNLKDKKVQFLEEFTARYGVQLKKEEDLLKESVETRIGEMRRLQLAGFTQQATQQAQGASGSNTAVTVSFGQVNINNGMDEQQFYQGVETAVTKAVKENNLGYN